MTQHHTTLRKAFVPARAVEAFTRGASTTAGLPRMEEIAVLAFASTRLTRAISLDEITAPLRDQLDQKAENGGRTWVWASKLVSCPACVGWWVSLSISVMLPGRHRLLRGASVAGLQMLLALLERLVSEEGREAISSADLVEARAANTGG
ncbi:MAG TPA: DUF1360 domain-containing protein [Ilumatobacteraceae bacterium]|nr:DUF1360 domain-containing protein [Ilumatobacteraceae bacterium]